MKSTVKKELIRLSVRNKTDALCYNQAMDMEGTRQEGIKPTEQEIASWKMKWQDLRVEGVPDSQKIMLDDLAANFMLSPYGRPGVLFQSLTDRISYEKMEPWLDKDKFSALQDTRENYLYLAKIARHLLDKRDPHFLEITQIIELIGDFDTPVFNNPSSKPFRDDHGEELQQASKFGHPDFIPLRVSLGNYIVAINKDDGFAKKVIVAIGERHNRLHEDHLPDKTVYLKPVIERMINIAEIAL